MQKGVFEEAQRGKEMGMKRDQKGFTIVELLIAVAILSIVVASVCGFILVGSRSYAAGNSDINVQQESQLALNQMSDVMIDTTRSVNYVGYDAGGNPETALKDAEFSFTPEDKSLIMYNGVVEKDPSGGADTLQAGNGNKHYHFYWNREKETLFYAEQPVVSTVVESVDILNNFPDVTNADPDADPASSGWYVLAQHVTDFSVDLSQVEEKRVVQLALTFLDGRKEYVTSNNVTIRNKVGVNDAELAPLNRRVEISIAVKPSIVMEPGETFTFPVPTVTGKNVTDKSVEWSISSAVNEDVTKIPDWDSPTQFTDTDNGILHLSSQAKGSFEVKVTTKAEDSDHNKASATVRVNIKRVNDITLWKSYDSNPENGANEISPGCTFTISAKVTGDYLGEVCDACGEDISIDKHILSTKNTIGDTSNYVWRVWTPKFDGKENEEEFKNWHPEDHVILDAQDEYSATFHVEPNVPDGGTHGYVIQALSLLSYHRPYGSPTYAGRRYDWVWRSIDLKVVKNNPNIGVKGSLQWGAVAEIWHEMDYPEGFNTSGQGYFLICARIREEGSTGPEKVMIYTTTGINSLVTPDMFGVDDISKPWTLSLQVIDPGKPISGGVNPKPGVSLPGLEQITDPTVRDVVQDYISSCNASGNGTYNGKYPHTGKFVGHLMPPEIFYAYNGQGSISGKLELNKVNTLAGPAETSFMVDYVKNTRGERDGVTAFTNDHLKFSVYKEKNGGKESIYWYDSKDKNFKGSSGAFGNTLQFGNFESGTREPRIKLEMNNKSWFAEAAGRYQIVPSISYKQKVDADTSYSIYYASYQPKYDQEQCYEVPESTVYYELTNGGNVDAFWSYYNNDKKFTKGEIYFPTPSEAGFTSYFDREQTEWKEAKWKPDFTKTIVEGGSGTTTYQPSSMKCRYVADKKGYELELFYHYYDESTWKRTIEISAGVFCCAADGDRWVQRDQGPYDRQLPDVKPDCSTADVKFSMKGTDYDGKVYIPLPSESAFTDSLNFERKKASQEKDDFSIKYQKGGNGGLQDMHIDRLACIYDKDNDEYTIMFIVFPNGLGDKNTWIEIAAYRCKSGGDRWIRREKVTGGW